MPKVPKVSQVPRSKPRKDERVDSKRKAPKIEEISELVAITCTLGVALTSFYQQTHQVHFDELNQLWPTDRRIPSIKSRRAWALARNLNPTNVNSWWYRRRKVAKKLKISIPPDTYELAVGVPPEIPKPVLVAKVKEEAVQAVLDSQSSVDVAASNEEKSGDLVLPFLDAETAHIVTSDTDSGCLASSDTSSATLFLHDGGRSPSRTIEDCGSVFENYKKGAHLRFSSLDRLSSVNPDPYSRANSPFSLSSPSAPNFNQSPSPNLLSLHPIDDLAYDSTPLDSIEASEMLKFDDAVDLGGFQNNAHANQAALRMSFSLLESFYPAYVLPQVTPASAYMFDFSSGIYSNIPLSVSACSSTPLLDINIITQAPMIPALAPFFPSGSSLREGDGDLVDSYNNEAPWCLDGYRISWDGSMVGVCSGCYHASNPFSL